MKKTRRKFTVAFKAQLAIEALKERETLAALSARFEVHPNQISQWKQEFIDNSEKVFSGAVGKEKEEPVHLEALYAKIGQLEIEWEFLKKLAQERSLSERKLLIQPKSMLSIRQQCLLLSICRASFYYSPRQENAENLQMMLLMDAHILQEPIAGVLTMQSMLEEKGYKAGYERVRRLMRLVNIRPIYLRKYLTQLGDRQYIYPYLLRNLKVERRNQVWAIDICRKALCT